MDGMTTAMLVKPTARESYRAVLAEDIPAIMTKGIVYIIGPANSPWFAALTCPCGCGQKIYAKLGPRPDHSICFHHSKLCLIPEIFVPTCGSRFSVYEGKILWR